MMTMMKGGSIFSSTLVKILTVWTLLFSSYKSSVTVVAFDYDIVSAGSIVLQDNNTQITDLATIFVGDIINVFVDGLEWEYTGNFTSVDAISYTTIVNGEVQDTGTYANLGDVNRVLPTGGPVGFIQVDQSGTATIEVILEVNESTASTTSSYQVYRAGVSIIPLIFILIMAMTTKMVELSLFSGIWLGACIVTGSLKDGFTTTLDTYLVGALADEDHVFVILFTVFLSGTVGMMQKSGGMLGFTRDIAKIAKTPRTGMAACFCVGVIIFFDDYANVLLAGETMRPLSDLLTISREKLSFVVDATSAPIASISPISSWVGFEVGLIDDELAKIEARLEETGGTLTVNDSGFGVFLQSIKYRYYPIFMLVLVMMLIALQRDFGPMLLAERQVRVYDRTDGGPNKGKGSDVEGAEQNQPREDQPLYSFNMLLPVIILVILIFIALVNSGDDGSGTQTFLEKIENSNSYVALLYGTMGAAWIAIILYLLQITIPGTGTLTWPTPKVLYDMLPWRSEQVEVQPRFLMSIGECVESFLFGMVRIFLAIVVLTLAWASGDVMTTVGCDRLFANWIVGGIPTELLPTLSFVVSLLMALATGTSWGTMSILFPLILVPTYFSSDGNTLIFYSVVAGVLSGAVAGDHMSPISDTTVLSALACDVTLIAHVVTQAPYVLFMCLFSIIFGTIPIGYDAWPNMVGIALGWVCTLGFVYGICVPIISPTGRWDIFMKFCCSRNQDPEMFEQLTQDTIKKANGETVEMKEPELFVIEGGDDDDDGLGKGKGGNDDEAEEEAARPNPALEELKKEKSEEGDEA